MRMNPLRGNTCSGYAVPLSILMGFVLFCVLIAGCTGTNTEIHAPLPTPGVSLSYHNITKLEVVFIHPVPGCSSCEAVGAFANETIQTYFAHEVAAGRLTFVDVNLNLKENRDIVERYGAYSESLWFGIYDDDGFHKEENFNVWYRIYNKQDFMTYLKGELEQKLNGNSTAYGPPAAP